jgi:hypothetical protein
MGKLVSNDEPKSGLECVEEDFHGAFGDYLCDVCVWLNKYEKDSGYQNFNKEETAQ